MQNINGKDQDGDALDMKLVPRFQVGVFAEIPIAPDFYFQPGLTFITKGAKSENEFLGIDLLTVEYNVSYIELPLSLLYKPQLGEGWLFIGFGPYVSYGVGGKAKFEGIVDTEQKIEFTKAHDGVILPSEWKYFKPFDYGGNLFFGYEMGNGISIQVNTQLGFAKINSDNNDDNDETSFRNTGYGLGIGYNF